MFSIDLLQGKGLPRKTDLKQGVLRTAGLLIPVLAAAAFAASYQHGRIELHARKDALQAHQQEIEGYSQDVAEYNKVSSDFNGLQKCLKDISTALSYRIQVSDLLVELAGALPESIFLYEMKLDRNTVVEKIQEEGQADVKQRTLVRRKLNLVLCGYDAERSDPAVQDYITRLKQSSLLSNVFTQIKPTARQQGQVDGKEAVYYEIECILKEQG